jgi:facilitated trehalose transporter
MYNDSIHVIGINAVTFYAVSIFRNTSPAGSTMDAHIPSIILASTQLIASFTSSLLVEKYGRKLLLGVSSIMMATAGTMLGTYFYFQAQLPYLSWVPLASLILFAFGFAVGYGPVSWILVAEILPNEIRHFMNPIAIGYNWFCTFLVTKSFPLLLLEINIYGVFWMFACIALLGLVFVILCVPETKGKTDDEIRRFFGVQCTNYDIDNSFNEEIVDCSENSGGGDGDKETDNIKGNGEQV